VIRLLRLRRIGYLGILSYLEVSIFSLPKEKEENLREKKIEMKVALSA
jgi:hypothetical protein